MVPRLVNAALDRREGDTPGSVYLAVISLAELFVLLRMWVNGIHAPIDPLLQGIVGVENKDNFSFKLVVSFLQMLLVVARWFGHRSRRGLSKSHLRGLIALHLTEVMFIIPLFFTNFWPARHTLDLEVYCGGLFIFCGILIDPIILYFILS
eukprot:CAMPEP_0174849668 /NCGR_PEP_ID=MMETSP1114-20130205/16698_1 /TAXON_ID=312471 /ORGANISM="Neobodo designis, Strain CCAP 1951/1" /LENGTH=150 /DNA_ID=CAMNT_0016084049 /DNA_START=42 /DNA_END=490 /DNA_ORIENTATION=-